jgi:hypothetical protein
MAGRIRLKDYRCYVDGYDLSGYSRTIGPLEITYDEADLTAYMGDTVKGYLPNMAHANVGTLNAVFDNTATVGLHALMATAGVERNVLVPIGMRAAPVDGDPCFGGQFKQSAYQVTEDGGGVTVTLPFAGWAADAATLGYSMCWGQLLHANAARTNVSGVNAGDGFDNPTGGATLKGGFFLYQVLASNAAGVTATLSVDDGTSAADADMDPLAGATTGAIVCVAGVHGIVVPTTLTIRQYLRWQIAFGTATSVTWVAAFFRKY